MELAPAGTAEALDAHLEREIHRRLLGTWPGLRIAADGLENGEVLKIEVIFAIEPEPPVPYFLAKEDSWALNAIADGWKLQLILHEPSEGQLPMRGLLLPGNPNVTSLDAQSDMGTVSFQVGSGSPAAKAALGPRQHEVSRWIPESPYNTTVLLFGPRSSSPQGADVPEPAAEIKERLKTLGYVQ